MIKTPERCRTWVATLMRRMDIQALYRKPNTSKKHPAHPVFPYLLRDKAIERANQAWALDTRVRHQVPLLASPLRARPIKSTTYSKGARLCSGNL
jgi:hypothetical protein